MASVKKPARAQSKPDASVDPAGTRLVIGLHDPGMTPLLRAGLGGLAAAVQAIPDGTLPTGAIAIEPDRVVLDWTTVKKPEALLRPLFTAAFRIDRNGLIDLPGSYRAPQQDTAVRAALTDALRRTFLQHGKHADREGKTSALTIEIDGGNHTVAVQRHHGFIHQENWKGKEKAWKDIAAALTAEPAKRKGIGLAGWANPGASTRHAGFSADTGVDYSPALALCACFAITGCISLCGPGPIGILIIPEPLDLHAFTQVRGELAPHQRADCYVGCAGDGALAVAIALRADRARQWSRGIARVHAMTLSTVAWVQGGQKVRVDTLACSRFPDHALDSFAELTSHCPTRQIFTQPKKKGELTGCWTIPSNLRGFVADNLVRGHPWFHGFSIKRYSDHRKRPRFRWIHRYYTTNDKLGCLRLPDDKKGLIAMTKILDEAQRLLIMSVHTALRCRYGKISKENKENDVARNKRSRSERDKWRMQLAGAKTAEQVRAILADLWSRAGTVKELQTGWESIIPLLNEHWLECRDLSLVALASYQGKDTENEDTDAAEENPDLEQ
ncbi:MAG: type I-MYXAN CRISPR-associated Cas8a1/Cmx1 [Planctomycetes bacterium]|nr:type I-MYXAN CRISPR-associated Cas8a1/Cmx1 [Planctomycetota bacterium]